MAGCRGARAPAAGHRSFLLADVLGGGAGRAAVGSGARLVLRGLRLVRALARLACGGGLDVFLALQGLLAGGLARFLDGGGGLGERGGGGEQDGRGQESLLHSEYFLEVDACPRTERQRQAPVLNAASATAVDRRPDGRPMHDGVLKGLPIRCGRWRSPSRCRSQRRAPPAVEK